MYKDDEELNKLEIEDLLNIDLEKISELKDKAKDLIEACNEQKDNTEGRNEELLIFFGEKLNDLNKNEANLQTFINYVDKVDTLVFTENKTQVNFNT
jgi:predicted RNA-binding protein with EMAP domain